MCLDVDQVFVNENKEQDSVKETSPLIVAEKGKPKIVKNQEVFSMM